MFKNLKTATQQQFDKMKKHSLFVVGVDKNSLWETYLSSFPAGSNPMYKERTEHDCQCCKHFIRAMGGVVSIIGNKLESIWDIKVDGPYQVVADAMSAMVKANPIENIFLHTESTAGVNKNHQLLESGEILTWEHFFVKIPNGFVTSGLDKGGKLSEAKSTRDVFHRSLSEITLGAVDTVLELIDQNSIYRGEENRFIVDAFRKQKMDFDNLHAKDKELFCWSVFGGLPKSVTNFRNTAIGTLVTDISDGRDLESAVGSFEAKVAPTNYKRPTALITKAMIQNARKKVEELGFTPALDRRYAVAEDITINNVLFANREAKKQMNVFDELADRVPEKIKNLKKVEEVNINTFVEKVLPHAESIELLFENKHSGNLVSLVAPMDTDAKGMFKWHNNFSWAYTGELADSIKERVKNAGGNVEGDLRCSLSWFNYDDLDLHMTEPDGKHIYFRDKHSRLTGGNLDVDMNAGGASSRNAVENICYPDKTLMTEGLYLLGVHNYSRRESIDVGFDVEIEFDGVVHAFSYAEPVRENQEVTVAKFEYTKNNGIKFIESLKSSQVSKEIWGLSTQQFHKVSMLMYSPNYWDGKATGNRHYFFMLENCLNDGRARGFFNEFLTNDLREHRKVFEVLGAKMKTQESNNQLSGLGFSSTRRNSVLCRVDGNFSRIIKIIF